VRADGELLQGRPWFVSAVARHLRATHGRAVEKMRVG